MPPIFIRSAVIPLALALTPARADTPLADIAADLPAAAATGQVELIDFDAARAEIPEMVPDGWSAPYFGIQPPQVFDLTMLLYGASPIWPRDEMGFALDDIGQLAVWSPPEGPPAVTMLLRGSEALKDAAAIGAALEGTGHAVRDVSGVAVWHRLEDGRFDPDLALVTPFETSLGLSTRFAIVGDSFVATRLWAEMEAQIGHAEGGVFGAARGFLDVPGVAALLAATEAEETGRVMQMMFVQPVLAADQFDPALVLGQRADAEAIDAMRKAFGLDSGVPQGLPRPFAQAFWTTRDGARDTGHVGLAYLTRGAAEAALAMIADRIETLMSLSTTRPYGELLPPVRRFELREAGEGFVAVVSFSTGEPADPFPSNMLAFGTSYARLIDLWLRYDLTFLATE